MTVVKFPGRGLNPIDLGVIRFACQFLGWDVEVALTPEREAFAVLGSSEFPDVVFILTREIHGYVLTEFPAESDEPKVYAKGSLQAIFQQLPQAQRYRRSR